MRLSTFAIALSILSACTDVPSSPDQANGGGGKADDSGPQWHSEFLGYGWESDFTVDTAGNPVAAYFRSDSYKVRLGDGTEVALPEDCEGANDRFPEVAVDKHGVIHAFFRYGDDELEHVTYEDGAWKRHQSIRGWQMKLDANANGDMAALTYTFVDGTYVLSLYTLGDDGEMTGERLWETDELFAQLEVAADGTPSVAWTDHGAKTARKTAAGWVQAAAPLEDPTAVATSGGAKPIVLAQRATRDSFDPQEATENEILAFVWNGTKFTPGDTLAYGTDVQGLDATLDGDGVMHACSILDGNVTHIAVTKTGHLTTHDLGSGDHCRIAIDREGTLHMFWARQDVMRHATYE